MSVIWYHQLLFYHSMNTYLKLRTPSFKVFNLLILCLTGQRLCNPHGPYLLPHHHLPPVNGCHRHPPRDKIIAIKYMPNAPYFMDPNHFVFLFILIYFPNKNVSSHIKLKLSNFLLKLILTLCKSKSPIIFQVPNSKF